MRIPTTAVTITEPDAAPSQRIQSFAAMEPAAGGFSALVASVDEVIEDDTGEPITLQQAKDHLRVVVPEDDAYIQSLIATARQMAEGRLNRTLVQRTRTQAFEPGELRTRLLKPPIVEVTGVTVGANALLDEDYYLGVSGDNGEFVYLYPAPGTSWSRTGATVTYTAGYAPGQVPRPIIQWMLLVIGTMYENRETMSAGVQIYDMPADFVKWLLQPYMVYE